MNTSSNPSSSTLALLIATGATLGLAIPLSKLAVGHRVGPCRGAWAGIILVGPAHLARRFNRLAGAGIGTVTPARQSLSTSFFPSPQTHRNRPEHDAQQAPRTFRAARASRP